MAEDYCGGMKTNSPKAVDSSTKPQTSAKVDQDATRKDVPKVSSPGPRCA